MSYFKKRYTNQNSFNYTLLILRNRKDFYLIYLFKHKVVCCLEFLKSTRNRINKHFLKKGKNITDTFIHVQLNIN